MISIDKKGSPLLSGHSHLTEKHKVVGFNPVQASNFSTQDGTLSE